MPASTIGDYILGRRIGRGSFGAVYEVRSPDDPTPLAAKIERVGAKHPQLRYEARVYRLLKGIAGVPRVRWVGRGKVDGIEYEALVMDRMRQDLHHLHRKEPHRFTTRYVAELGIQMLNIIEAVHGRGIVHRDIKPQNWCVGYDGRIHLIDLGLSKRFVDPRSGAHIRYRDDKSLTGTPRYVSVHTMQGIEQSRRDDVISVFYLLVYFLKGSLPWSGLKRKRGAKLDRQEKKKSHRLILDAKLATSLRELCVGVPFEIQQCLSLARDLKFTDTPPYDRMRRLLEAVQ